MYACILFSLLVYLLTDTQATSIPYLCEEVQHECSSVYGWIQHAWGYPQVLIVIVLSKHILILVATGSVSLAASWGSSFPTCLPVFVIIKQFLLENMYFLIASTMEMKKGHATPPRRCILLVMNGVLSLACIIPYLIPAINNTKIILVASCRSPVFIY